MPLVNAAATTSGTIVKGEFHILNYNGSIETNFETPDVVDSKEPTDDGYVDDDYLTTFTTNGTVGLRFAEADDKTGRQAGYHLAIQATAPTALTTTEELGKIKYSTDGKTWKSAGLKSSDKVLNKWYNITEEEYDAAKKNTSNVVRELYLDWDGNGTTDQVVKMVIRTGDLTFNKVDEGGTALHTVTVKNNVDNGEVKLTVVNNKSLDDLADSVLNSVKTKSGYEFVRFYTTVNEEKKDYETSTEVTTDVTIVAEFKKSSSTATTPSGNQGSSTTKPADKDKDSTPKTGNTDLMGFVPLMTLLSLVGIVTLKKTI